MTVQNIYKLRLKIAAYFITPTHSYEFVYMYNDKKIKELLASEKQKFICHPK